MKKPPTASPSEAFFRSRRRFLREAGLGIGSLALTCLLHGEGLLAAPASFGVGRGRGLQPRAGHFPGPVRSVIQLVQDGGPSQIDLFDPKPELRKRDGQKLPANTVENFQPGSESQ